MSVNEKMTAIADAIRAKTGSIMKLSLDEMAAAIAGIEINNGKTVTGVVCTTSASNGKLIGDINNDGIVDSTDEELAGELMADGGYDEAADLDGDGMVSTSDLRQLSTIIASLAEGQIIANITISFDDGTESVYFAAVDAPEPGIDTSDATATAERLLAPYTAYVKGAKVTGTMKDNSKTTQHTAGASSNATTTGIRLAIPTAGYYTTTNRIFYSNADLADDIGLTADMLVKGNTVIGVEGTAETGGGGDIDGIIDGTATEISSNTLTKIRARAFYNFAALQSVSFPMVTEMGSYSFDGCEGLTNISLPLLTQIKSYGFRNCKTLTYINLPNVTKTDTYAFYGCKALVKADFAKLGAISYSDFQNCSALEALILRKTTVCTLVASDVFNGSGIKSGIGYIYVPSNLVNSYESASNWSTYASQIRAIEDYPEITGG